MTKPTLKLILLIALLALPFILILNQLETGSIFGLTIPPSANPLPIRFPELKQIAVFTIAFIGFLLCWLAVSFLLDCKYDCSGEP